MKLLHRAVICNSYLLHRIIDSFSRIKNIRLKPVLLVPRGRKPGLTKLVIIYYFYSNIHVKLSVRRCYTWLSVWLRFGSNPADINRLWSHTGIIIFTLSVSSDCNIYFLCVAKINIKYWILCFLKQGSLQFTLFVRTSVTVSSFQ